MTLSRPSPTADPRALDPLAAAARAGRVEPFYAMEAMREAAALEAAGRSIIHMEVGQPGGPAPEAARRALTAALSQPLGYTVALGLPALREGIAALYRRRYGLEVDPARVIVTSGSSAAFQFAFLALLDPGARLAMADPGYPSYRNIALALGIEPVGLPSTAEDRFQPTPALLREAARQGPIRAVLAASPANPTGTILDRAALTALIETSAELGAAFISDEIYHGLHYGARAVSALEISDAAIVINSFSKYFAMTGWRIGWMIVPERMVKLIERLAQNLYICPPHASQVAALAALSPEAESELEARRAGYAWNRAHLLEALPAAGLTRFAPADGAFYLYADLAGISADSDAWCARLLQEAGVAATPGRDFDPARGKGFARFSFAGSRNAIEEGARRIAAFLQG